MLGKSLNSKAAAFVPGPGKMGGPHVPAFVPPPPPGIKVGGPIMHVEADKDPIGVHEDAPIHVNIFHIITDVFIVLVEEIRKLRINLEKDAYHDDIKSIADAVIGINMLDISCEKIIEITGVHNRELHLHKDDNTEYISRMFHTVGQMYKRLKTDIIPSQPKGVNLADIRTKQSRIEHEMQNIQNTQRYGREMYYRGTPIEDVAHSYHAAGICNKNYMAHAAELNFILRSYSLIIGRVLALIQIGLCIVNRAASTDSKNEGRTRLEMNLAHEREINIEKRLFDNINELTNNITTFENIEIIPQKHHTLRGDNPPGYFFSALPLGGLHYKNYDVNIPLLIRERNHGVAIKKPGARGKSIKNKKRNRRKRKTVKRY